MRTSIGDSRPSTQIETLLAMIKRNLNVPEIQGQVFEDSLVELMFDKFVTTFVPDYHRDLFDAFVGSPIVPNAASLTEWVRRQKTEVLSQIDVDVPLHERQLNYYNFMIKSPLLSLSLTLTLLMFILLCRPLRIMTRILTLTFVLMRSNIVSRRS